MVASQHNEILELVIAYVAFQMVETIHGYYQYLKQSLVLLLYCDFRYNLNLQQSQLQSDKLMENNNQQKSLTIPPIYYLETILKAVFIPMAIFNLPFTIAIALAASLCGLLRMLKRPQFNKQYLQKVLMNNHGQNVLYLGMGCVGFTNFLFFAPLILYFFYGLAQFYKQIYPKEQGSPKINEYVGQIRNNRYSFMQTKSRLEIIYFLYLLFTIPIDFSRILKALLIGQFNMLKYRVTGETRTAATNINNFISNKISGIGFLHNFYNKIVDYIYKFANQNPAGM